MIDVVIDASVVLRWAFADEVERDGALRVAVALADGGLRAVAPPTLLAEVGGVLVRAVRAGRVDGETARAVMAELIRIEVDQDDPHGYAGMAMDHALAHGLHVQDAMYLEVARRTGATLISADRAQLDAAAAMRLVTMPVEHVPAWVPDSS